MTDFEPGAHPNTLADTILAYRRSGLVERLIGTFLLTERVSAKALDILKVLDITEKTFPDSIMQGPTILCYGEGTDGVVVQPRHYRAGETNHPIEHASRTTYGTVLVEELRVGTGASAELASLVYPAERSGIAQFAVAYAPVAIGQAIGRPITPEAARNLGYTELL
jgi:hypothetical protein